jgi:RNA polymerase sigma factor (sigma-70 family)
VSARQELDQLRVIVASLPQRCRRVFELRKLDGLSHRDVALRMGISEKTVEAHLTRALARVTEGLASLDSSATPSVSKPAQKRAADADRGPD